jgi:enoyl-CoA hydratase/carnithine racemase
MPEQPPCRVERDGPLAVIIVDSPPLNLMDDAMLDGLESSIGAVQDDPPRAVLFRFEGRIVTGGVDVHGFAALDSPQKISDWFERILKITNRFQALSVPTVFAVHELCLTWAFELSLGADIVLAAEAARFALVERIIGVTPGMGGTQRLAAIAGPRRAAELVFTGGFYDAATMYEWGVVNRVFPNEGFADAAYAFAMDLATGPTLAHAATKRVISEQQQSGVEAADRAIPEIEVGLFTSEDHQGARRSFLVDGPGRATFSGR